MFFLNSGKYLITGLIFFTIFLSNMYSVEASSELFENGKIYYSNGEYEEALYFFNEIIHLGDSKLIGDAYFWSAKTYIASGELAKAEKNLEYFLLYFQGNKNYNDAFYFKGRILFLQEEYDKSLELFNRFIRSNPFSTFTSNAYYWIGDCLYNTGHFVEALNIYKKLIEEFPNSFKLEAAQYKIALVEYRFREEELLQLIRWSHEDSMSTIESYRNREKALLESIESYQKRIIELESGFSNSDDLTLNRLKEATDKLESYLKQLESGQ